MRTLVIAGVAIVAAVSITSCGIGGSAPSPTASAAPTMRAVPGLAGKGLQTAEDDAHSAGFSNVVTHDASGRGRVQILYRDWKVCFQAPAAGTTVATSSKVDLGVVKLAEACPAADQGAQSPSPISEGQAMPDLTGRSLNVALSSLPASTSVTSKDVSGRGRMVLVPTNWRVCSQTPRAGTQFTGQPVTLGVVKYGESCP